MVAEDYSKMNSDPLSSKMTTISNTAIAPSANDAFTKQSSDASWANTYSALSVQSSYVPGAPTNPTDYSQMQQSYPNSSKYWS